MAPISHYTVTVSRIHEGVRQGPDFTTDAHTITLSQDGTLRIDGPSDSRFFDPASYEGISVRKHMSKDEQSDA